MVRVRRGLTLEVRSARKPVLPETEENAAMTVTDRDSE